MNDSLGQPQSVLVLGGSSDIARAVMRKLVGQRCTTAILAGPHRERLDEAAAELAALGCHTVATRTLDVTSVESHSAFAEEVFSQNGDIDLVLVATGLLGNQSDDEHDPKAAAAVMATNFTGPAAALLAIAEHLRRQGHGRIVVLTSVAGERVRRSNFIYGSAKSGLDGFCQGLAASLSGCGVRVIIVRPGFVATRMTAGMAPPPGPFTATADEVAAAIVKALGTGAEVVWVPSRLRWVMSMLRHVPAPVFRKLPG